MWHQIKMNAQSRASFYLLLLIVCDVFSTVWGSAVSFYGESQIHLPLNQASSETHIHLEFKTYQPYGLLLLAVGTTDFISVEIYSGIIEVRIDLGSGVVILKSSQGLRLNDLIWHTVEVSQIEEDISLNVDNVTQTNKKSPGRFFELNINKGIFLGSTGSFQEFTARTFRNFRGCMRNIIYNSLDILEKAKESKNIENNVEVAWDCDKQFRSSSSQPIQFTSDNSFVAFPYIRIREEGTISFDLKTRIVDGIIFYNAGRRTSKDFLALEISSGNLKLSFNRGNGVIDVISNSSISDGIFHQIDIFLSSSIAEITIDGIKTRSRFSGRYKYYLDLGGHLYMGGLGQQVRAYAIQQGISSVQEDKAMKGSLIGCIQNIVVNSRQYSFRDIQISRSIKPGCKLDPICDSGKTCKPGYQCQLIQNVETCVCTSNNCSTSESEKNVTLNGNDVLVVQSIKVMEGGSSKITSNILDVVFDYHKFRIRESAIQFHVKVPPHHGRIEIHRNRRRNGGVFTLLDVMSSAIYYIHDGSETLEDDAILEMQIRSTNRHLPKKLREIHEFVLPIEVTPRNDIPRILIGHQGTFNVVKNSRIKVHNSTFFAEDYDNLSSELIYSVTYQGSGSGYFEKTGRRLHKFSQAEVNDGEIFFVHRGRSVQYVRLQINDKKRVGNYVDLKVRAEEMKITVRKNTGLILPSGSEMFISSENLTSSCNADIKGSVLLYQVTEPPRHGLLQYLQNGQQCNKSDKCENTSNKRNNKLEILNSDTQLLTSCCEKLSVVSHVTWETTDNFTQQQINDGKLRYKHTGNNTDAIDHFKFIVKMPGYSTKEEKFEIIISKLSLIVKHNNILFLNKSDHVVIKNTSLMVLGSSPNIRTEDIIFTVVRPPSQGLLYLFDKPGSDLNFETTPSLRMDSSFSQQNINDQLVYFKLRKAVFRKISDFVDFRVSSRDLSPLITRLSLQYIPEESGVKLTNNGLQNVIEGGQMAIERDDLYLETKEFKDFQFIITTLARCGQLIKVDPRSSAVLKENITEFTTRDIRDGRVIYEHDDSEQDHDEFEFRAIPIVLNSPESKNDFVEFNGKFEITVAMRNDNPPIRVVNKVFHVTTNSERLITVDDIYFTDPDIGYNTDHLQYSRGAVSNGDILYIADRSSAKQFTQKDIIDKKLVFHHSGALHGRIAIWVTDGQFYSTGLLEIQASNPYIKIVNNTGLHVAKASSTLLSTYNLSIETNLNVSNNEIKIIIIQEPFNGEIEINGIGVTQFTYKDLHDGKVMYKHTGSKIVDDFIEFGFVAGAVKVQVEFIVSMILDDNFKPKVSHNRLLEVQEMQTVIITDNFLLIEHPSTLPGNILYIVTTHPHNGKLIVNGQVITGSTSTKFTQDDINNGRIRYRHSKEETVSDFITFDVSNDARHLVNLQLDIEIIPNDLPLILKNLNVQEGGKIKFSKEYIRVDGQYFSKINFVFEVLESPKHGWLESIDDKALTVSSFSSQDIELGKIFYVHDDSESSRDNLTIRAIWPINQKQSKIKMMNISVVALNDQLPKLVSPSTLYVWQGTISAVDSSMLKAEDLDTKADQLVFRVTTPTNGYFATNNSSDVEIDSFTQQQINREQIVFVHKGPVNGQFSVEIVDGDLRSKLRTIQVVAKTLKITLRKNKKLKVYPKSLHKLTEEDLLTTVNTPTQSNPIVYKVLRKPRKGRIITNVHGDNLEISSFTQKEIRQGSIYYHHDNYIDTWSTRDSFMFSVSTLHANSIEEVFYINISYSNLNNQTEKQLLTVKDIIVDEGGQTTISNSILDVTPYLESLKNVGRRVEIEYVMVTAPKHGVVQLSGKNLVEGSTFLQHNITENRVKYIHDDSDSTYDSIVLHLNITDRTLSTIVIEYPLTINITIRPINDEQFRVITRNPGIEIVRGTNITITKSDLLTVDNDTTADKIIYEVISNPDNGMLYLKPDINSRITRFTQQDINDGLLHFQHDKHKDNGTFYFRVSDGKFRPYYKVFTITAVDISLRVSVNKTVEITQSESSVYITSNNLNISTNGIRDMVLYSITEKPRYGSILVDGKPVHQFKQTDIDKLNVIFLQTDMTSSSDTFTCDISINNHVNLKSKIVDILVKPLVDQQPVNAPVGTIIAITQFHLNAAKLEAITGSNPVYKISRQPSFGRIVKNRRGKRHLGEKDGKRSVSSFTHEDIIYLKIFYEVNTSSIIDLDNVTDSFHYILSADNVQPAEGVFYINLLPPEMITTSTSLPDYNTTYTIVTASGVVSPNISEDISFIVWILIGLALLLIVVIIVLIVVIRRKRKRKQYEMENQKHPRLLPQISDPMLISSPQLHKDDQLAVSSESQSMLGTSPSSIHGIPVVSIRDAQRHSGIYPNTQTHLTRSPDINNTEISQTIPGCKVTPLIDNPDNMSQSDETEFSVNLFNDLSLIDPEFRDLCNASTPVLKDKKYWV